MITLKEGVAIILTTFVFAFVVAFGKIFHTGGLSLTAFLTILLACFLVQFLFVISKKVTGSILDAEVEHKILGWQRFGIYERSTLKNPLPVGIIIPFVLSVISQGYVLFLTFLQFEVQPLIRRARKHLGTFRYSEMTEIDICYIAMTGVITLLVFGFIAYIIGGDFFSMFGKLAIYYAFWNVLPLGQLDGNKILFGDIGWWVFTVILAVIALGYSFFLI